MKINSTSLFLLASLTISINACKKDKDSDQNSDQDYSNYQLSKIKFNKGRQSVAAQLTFEYDTLNRLTRRTHELPGFNSIATYVTFKYQKNAIIKKDNFGDSRIYKTDDNGRIISDIVYPEMDSTYYEYDAQGYLVNKRVYRYIYALRLWQDTKYTYQNGNMTKAVIAFYDGPDYQLSGADTTNFSYDNTAWFPEAKYLDYVPDVLTGKPNRNNITDIHVIPFMYTWNPLTEFRDIHYTYNEKGNRLAKVTMDFTDRFRFRDTIDIDFTYKPKD